jgi:hypothetical protein
VEFEHYDDPSVDLAIDLINGYGTATRAAGGHASQPLPDLEGFLRDHQMESSGLRDGDERAAQRLADRLHTVFMTDDPAHATTVVNEVLVDAGAMPQISGHDDKDGHLHYDPQGAHPVDRLAVTAAMGLATVLCNAGLRRFGLCHGVECRDVYVDTSRNNRRRFCGDGCANRAHVAAHRARRRDSP